MVPNSICITQLDERLIPAHILLHEISSKHARNNAGYLSLRSNTVARVVRPLVYPSIYCILVEFDRLCEAPREFCTIVVVVDCAGQL